MEFKWTDELVTKFARICSNGSYGAYTGCKTIEQKLTRFKALNCKGQNINKEAILQLTGEHFDDWYSGLDEEGKKKYSKVFNELQSEYGKNKSVG